MRVERRPDDERIEDQLDRTGEWHPTTPRKRFDTREFRPDIRDHATPGHVPLGDSGGRCGAAHLSEFSLGQETSSRPQDPVSSRKERREPGWCTTLETMSAVRPNLTSA
ncbi:hypothetical protein GCM10023318_18080 [Nocardia callitridis]|uniref:Uncharacterized protein n=1 Tax=Nocardia callitridis TaxID=648753 RepID=A0ABP9K1E2_9NOCA